MSGATQALKVAEQQGITISLADDGLHLWVEPEHLVTAELHSLLVAHKPAILVELRAANEQPPAEHPRWLWFLKLARLHGVSASEVAARFTSADIAREILPEDDDERLRQWMQTLAESIMRDRFERPPPPKTDPSPGVTCAGCRHFERYQHPNLGRCAAGVASLGLSGHWGPTLHRCDHHQPEGTP